MLGILKAVSLVGGVVAFGAVASGGIISILPEATKMLEKMQNWRKEPVIENKQAEEETKDASKPTTLLPISEPTTTILPLVNEEEDLQTQTNPEQETQTDSSDRSNNTDPADNVDQTKTKELEEQKAATEKVKKEKKQQFQVLTAKVTNLGKLITQKQQLVSTAQETLTKQTNSLNEKTKEKASKTQALTKATETKTTLETDLKTAEGKEKNLKDQLTQLGATQEQIEKLLSGETLTFEEIILNKPN